MILVDTSVLIGYFKNAKGVPYGKLDHIIDNEIPYGICNYVYQELLQGARDDKEYRLLKEYLDTLPVYDLLHGKLSFENAALLFRHCRKMGITVRSTVDMLIAEIAIENNLYLLHDDVNFTNIARVCRKLLLY